jgi:hypothetical protein
MSATGAMKSSRPGGQARRGHQQRNTQEHIPLVTQPSRAAGRTVGVPLGQGSGRLRSLAFPPRIGSACRWRVPRTRSCVASPFLAAVSGRSRTPQLLHHAESARRCRKTLEPAAPPPSGPSTRPPPNHHHLAYLMPHSRDTPNDRKRPTRVARRFGRCRFTAIEECGYPAR